MAYRAPIGLLFLALVSTLSGAAYAEDQEPVFFGGEAMLSAGAISAITQEAEALWYNPAGLGLVQRNRISLSGSNIGARIRPRGSVLGARTPAGVVAADGDNAQFFFVPVGMGYARSINDRLGFGFSAFLRERDEHTTRTSLSLDPDEGMSGLLFPDSFLELGTRMIKVNIGVGLGWQLSSRLRLGVALFGNVLIGRTEITLQHDLAAEERTFPAQGVHLDLQHKDTRIQGYATVGLQWDITENWHLGLQWRTAEGVVWRTDSINDQDVYDALRPVLSRVVVNRLAEDRGYRGLEMVSQPRLRLALAYSSCRGWFGLEGEIAPPQHDEIRGYEKPLHWNVRLGGRFALTERFSVGGGFFTSNSSLAGPDGVALHAVDYYGITVGMQFRGTHRVTGNPRARDITFVTSMVGRYALGVGQIHGILFDPFSSELEYARSGAQDVMFYDLSWFQGTAILF